MNKKYIAVNYRGEIIEYYDNPENEGDKIFENLKFLEGVAENELKEGISKDVINAKVTIYELIPVEEIELSNIKINKIKKRKNTK